MARSTRTIPAPPEAIFDLLADAPAYGDFVVGAKNVRGHDPAWPEVGAELHHTSGVGPLQVRDRTEVLELDRPRRLALVAGLRPLGQATVVFTATPAASGTLLVVDEEARSGLLRIVWNRLFERATVARNDEMLARVEDEVLRRAGAR